jgi:hypothetical protein
MKNFLLLNLLNTFKENIMKRVFIVNAVKMPTVEELSEGAVPFVLLRWPLHKDQLPEHIQKELRDRGVKNLPSVNLNIPFTGGAVAALKKVVDLIMGGNRVGIEIEHNDDDMRVTGNSKAYLDVCPISINLKDIKILPSAWDAPEGTDEDEAYARLLNKAIKAAVDERMAKFRISQSGTPGGGEIKDDENTVDDGNVF